MRTRYAPSPTGMLHIGGVRTALYSYLAAKQTQGEFLLRIEDTDREREVPGAVENILDALTWAGIPPEEGVMLESGVVTEKGAYGPYTQSKRTEIYREHTKTLLESGHAYRCFCTKERLEEMRKEQETRKQAPMYDQRCLGLTPDEVVQKMQGGEPFVVRLNVPRDRAVTFTDRIRGEVSFQGRTIDDQVLLKSDGFPTYHLANVVDDHLMKIDLVLRGEEWLSSTPKHILLYEAFGWTPPEFGHLPLLLNADHSKLSKRQGDVSALSYRDKGYLPEAVLNFLAVLGWNPGTTQDVFSLADLVAQFSLDRVQKAGAVFDLQKLDWLQGQWMRKLPEAVFTQRVLDATAERFPQAHSDGAFGGRALLIRDRITFFHEAPDMLAFFYEEPHPPVELLANAKQKVTAADLPAIVDVLASLLDAIPEKAWNAETLLASAKEQVAKGPWKLGQLLWPLRAALTGREYSPGAVEVAAALGRTVTLARLRNARQALQ
ncbi:MAG: glutamyl/glutaminyl-tRNA synthetase [Candidatus Peregrinibacteria bacterium Gr01-1014_25]|nr:MAG: glutamyl/glutaminyl-tRNA synthetase [Candidatus Peregrinibacteria bacterium Gr01-1014_25]